MNLLCLAVDRLHAGYLGCYGNAWVGTPHIDALAAESLVLDAAILDTPDLAALYHSLWRGVHAAEQMAGVEVESSLPEVLAQAGVATALMTDEAAVAAHPVAARFAETIHLPEPRLETADDIDETHLAGVTAAALEWLDAARGPFCLWLHTGSLGRAWDAPLALRNRYAEEDEAPPPELVEVPQMELPEEFDPDERLGIAHAYAGQVSLWDTCLGMLLETMADRPWGRDTLVALVGLRGLPLGLHGRIGTEDTLLSGELVHLPWLLRLPDGRGTARHCPALAQPCDLPLTLLDAIGRADDWRERRIARSLLPWLERQRIDWRECAVTLSPAEQAIRTRAWYLRQPADGSRPRLYAKPDDFWELNEIADRCPEAVVGLQAALDEFLAACRGEGPSPKLPEWLTSTWR